MLHAVRLRFVCSAWPPWLLQALISCFLLSWRPSDSALLIASGVLQTLQQFASVHALAALYDQTVTTSKLTASAGKLDFDCSWKPWPFSRVCSALQNGLLSKVEVLTHIQVRNL